MEIRFLTSADADEWWKLRLQALLGDPEAFSPSAEEHQSLTLEEVKKRLGSEAEDSFVAGAFDGARLASMAGFFREKGPKVSHKGRIWGVYLAPEFRGKGMGRALLKTVLDRATAINEVEQILISVTSTRAAAANLYRSLGFKRFGLEPRALKIVDRRIDEEYMILVVQPTYSMKSEGSTKKRKRPRLNVGTPRQPSPGTATTWILRAASSSVNVTLVIRIAQS